MDVTIAKLPCRQIGHFAILVATHDDDRRRPGVGEIEPAATKLHPCHPQLEQPALRIPSQRRCRDPLVFEPAPVLLGQITTILSKPIQCLVHTSPYQTPPNPT